MEKKVKRGLDIETIIFIIILSLFSLTVNYSKKKDDP